MKLIVLGIVSAGLGLVGSAVVLGCGDSEGLPENAVAEVGDAVITKSDFERALTFAAGQGHDPRDYAACVAAKRQTLREAGEEQPDEPRLEKQCRDEYEAIKTNVMDYLIKAEWTRQEAEARGIVLSDPEIQQAVARAGDGGLLDPETLASAGVSHKQLIARIRQTQLQSKVTERLTARSRSVSAKDVTDTYRQHKAELIVPEQRDLRLVIARTRAKAEAARAALEEDQAWRSVAKEYSIHVASRDRGGRIANLREDKQATGLLAAIFRAGRGDLTGPAKGDDGWAVFVVERINPSHQATLDEVRDQIRGQLRSARVRQAIDAYTERYRDITTCAPGFMVAACQNGPPDAAAQPSS